MGGRRKTKIRKKDKKKEGAALTAGCGPSFKSSKSTGLSSLLLLPLSWHETMVIEEKYGFNKTTAGTFWADQIKQVVVSLILMTSVGGILMAAHQKMGDWLILAFAVLMTLLMLGLAFMYPFFSRLFNKFKPLEEGELKDKITALLEKWRKLTIDS